MLRTKTIQWGDLCVTVREPTAMDMFEEPQQWRAIIDAVWGKDKDYSDIGVLGDWFLMIVARTETANIGHPFPNGNVKPKEYRDLFEHIKTLPGGFVTRWRAAIRELEQPPIGDPDLAPPDDLDNEQKKILES